MNRKVALVICFLFGLVMFLQYFSQHPVARTMNQTVLEYWQIIFAFTLLVGVVSAVFERALFRRRYCCFQRW